MDDIVSLASMILLAFLVAGFVKGVIGLGLPTVAMGLLSLALPPVQAAAILLVPSLATNIWQAVVGPSFWPLLRRMATMLLGIWAGALGGAAFLIQPDARATAGLGLALMAYAVLGLSPLSLSAPKRAQVWLAPTVGIVTGLITAATGVFVLPAGPYLQAIGLARDELVQALGISFTVSTLALAAALGVAGALPHALAGASLLAVLPAIAGMVAGQAIRQRISPAAFRRWFFFGLLALGAHLVARAVL
ncbi:MAG TPA: sulfite exporter TauE/SafE family protein [Xanthobacteraceae bacterium]|nr:sulfite exporter TauE/SafE family protein [Xanthobacteraceae bacterium]